MLVSKLAIIEEFAKDAHISPGLKDELRSAIQYSTERSSLSWSDKQSILNELPKKLRYELALAMHQGAAKSLNFFEGKDAVFVSAIVPFMQPLFVKVKSLIFDQGEYADEIYFIISGRVSYVVEKNGFVYRSLQQGSYFGDIEVIRMIPRKYTVEAAMDSNLLTMKKPLIEVIQSDFPTYWEEMKTVAEARDAVNEKSRKQFLNLLALKKAGQLDSSTPQLVREKLQRFSFSRPKDSEKAEDSVTVASLQKEVVQSQVELEALQADVWELRQAAEDILELLLVKEGKKKEPLTLYGKGKSGTLRKDT